MNATISGSCACGSITYQIASETPLYTAYCHCSQCRKSSGSAFAAIAGFRASELTITAGDGLLAKYKKSDATRICFCRNCGSNLFAEKIEDSVVHLRLGTVDTQRWFKPLAHVHLASKAAWYEIPQDGLLRFDGAPPRKRIEDHIHSREATSV